MCRPVVLQLGIIFSVDTSHWTSFLLLFSPCDPLHCSTEPRLCCSVSSGPPGAEVQLSCTEKIKQKNKCMNIKRNTCEWRNGVQKQQTGEFSCMQILKVPYRRPWVFTSSSSVSFSHNLSENSQPKTSLRTSSLLTGSLIRLYREETWERRRILGSALCD